MAFGVPPALYVDNQPRPPHRFNYDVTGPGRDYLNRALAGDSCIVRIQAGTAWRQLPRRVLFLRTVTFDCHISTDTQPTILQGNVADKLGLRPVKPFIGRVNTFLRTYAGSWCKNQLWLSIGPGYMPLEVWFPVQHGPHGWRWQFGFPQWNVLGMTDVLKRRMLCVTSQEVYAFERL
jgi:hypothetical protein